MHPVNQNTVEIKNFSNEKLISMEVNQYDQKSIELKLFILTQSGMKKESPIINMTNTIMKLKELFYIIVPS